MFDTDAGLAVADETETGTVRIRADLIEMVRVICAHDRTPDGKRVKAVELLDGILRPALTARHADVIRRVVKDADRKGKRQ